MSDDEQPASGPSEKRPIWMLLTPAGRSPRILLLAGLTGLLTGAAVAAFDQLIGTVLWAASSGLRWRCRRWSRRDAKVLMAAGAGVGFGLPAGPAGRSPRSPLRPAPRRRTADRHREAGPRCNRERAVQSPCGPAAKLGGGGRTRSLPRHGAPRRTAGGRPGTVDRNDGWRDHGHRRGRRLPYLDLPSGSARNGAGDIGELAVVDADGRLIGIVASSEILRRHDLFERATEDRGDLGV